MRMSRRSGLYVPTAGSGGIDLDNIQMVAQTNQIMSNILEENGLYYAMVYTSGQIAFASASSPVGPWTTYGTISTTYGGTLLKHGNLYVFAGMPDEYSVAVWYASSTSGAWTKAPGISLNGYSSDVEGLYYTLLGAASSNGNFWLFYWYQLYAFDGSGGEEIIEDLNYYAKATDITASKSSAWKYTQATYIPGKTAIGKNSTLSSGVGWFGTSYQGGSAQRFVSETSAGGVKNVSLTWSGDSARAAGEYLLLFRGSGNTAFGYTTDAAVKPVKKTISPVRARDAAYSDGLYVIAGMYSNKLQFAFGEDIAGDLETADTNVDAKSTTTGTWMDFVAGKSAFYLVCQKVVYVIPKK